MSKGHRNVPHPGYFKVAGGSAEEPGVALEAKQALAREKARLRKRAGLKTRLGEAPPEQHAPEVPGPPVAAMKEELADSNLFAEDLGETVQPAEKRPGLVRALAGRAFGAARLVLGLAGQAVRLPFRVVRVPFRVLHWLRHHDEQTA